MVSFTWPVGFMLSEPLKKQERKHNHVGRIKRAKIKQDLDEKREEAAHMEKAFLCLMSRWEGTHLGMTSSPLISPSASLRHATSWVSKIYRDNSIPAESPAFPTGSRSIRTNTFSMTFNRIWLSGSAPSRLIQRSSTMPGSSSTSLRGSVRDPRAWPQLWDSYLQTQIIWLAFSSGWIRCWHRCC